MKRQDFLANIQRSLQTSHLPAAHPQRPQPLALASFDPRDLVDQFTAQVVALQGEVHLAASHAAACRQIFDIFAQYQATDFISWADEYLPLPGLNTWLGEQGLLRRPDDIPHEAGARQETQLALSNVAIGITGALAGLAETGSLALQCGAGRGRLASLLPPVHIALLETRLLYPSLAHFIAAHPQAAKQSSNLIFISGPSRTADIEQTLTLGVHGPKELHIIMV